MPLILLALSMLTKMLISGTRHRTLNRETALVASRVQDVFERMRNEDFREVFALHNADAFDDPNGPGTAPGHRFAIEGLDPIPGVEDGCVGEVFFPAVDVGTEVAPVWELREQVEDERLGMPRDLNGDSVIDGFDHGGDYTILPVHVQVRWRGAFGEREFNMHTLLSEYTQ